MEKVIIGMSGGVDSSVAAYLLKKQGYEVIGISFKFIDDFDDTDAKNVAEKLGIEFYTVDYRKEFQKQVIDKFIMDYKNGITPNPCVICNRFVKMKFLYDEMEKRGADYIATGHYAKNDRGKLYRSVDIFKDQTYFLSLVPMKIISKTLFPLEGINKEEVRSIASDIGLSVYDKKDSVDVCFINSKFNEFMNERVKNTPGDVILIPDNIKIGKHNGLSLYTIGQRKGLNIGGYKEKLFVIGKSVKDNILYVAGENDTDYLLSDECILRDINIISYHHPTFGTAKFRYTSKEIPVTIEYINESSIKVTYMNGAKSITPGQTCALYMGEECIGGGIIDKVYKNGEELWYL